MRELEIFADGIVPEAEYIENLLDNYGITGFTANPSLIKQYLPIDYRYYCQQILKNARGFPVSIQVLTNDLDEMYKQAYDISSWGQNVYVKIPIVTSNGQPCSEVIYNLLEGGIKVNVTAIFSASHVVSLIEAGGTKEHDCVLSVFSGRIADTGRLPNDIIKKISGLLGSDRGRIKLLWAGVRSLGDIHSAKEYCDIITIPQPILEKLKMNGKDLNEYAIETVQMFAKDSENFSI